MNNSGVTRHHPGLGDGPIYLDYNATTPVDPQSFQQPRLRRGAQSRAGQGPAATRWPDRRPAS